MIENKVSKLGDKKNKYDRQKGTNTGKKFSWVHHPAGKIAKVLIGVIGSEKLPEGSRITRDIAGSGLTDRYLFSTLVGLLPFLPEMYFQKRGKRLTPRIVGQRFHKMLYHTAPKGQSYTVSYSKEYPPNDPKLRPLLTEVETLFKRGTPCTLEEILEIHEKVFTVQKGSSE